MRIQVRPGMGHQWRKVRFRKPCGAEGGGGRRPGGFGEFFVPVDGLHHVDYISGALSARTPLIFRNFRARFARFVMLKVDF